MNTLLQIVIVCSDQCITEIPGIFTERIVIDMEPKSLHILYHKHRSCSCIPFAEGMNLPNIRCELCKVFYCCFDRKAFIRELLFGGEIIIQCFFYAVEISVDNRLAVQYPLFFRNVILADLPSVVEDTFK